MKLIIPHPGHFAALKEIIAAKEAGGLNEASEMSEVSEVYMAGSPEVLGSGRATLHAALIDEIREQTEYAHQHRLKMNIVLNPSCLGGFHLTFEGYRIFEWYFGELEKAGVDGVTVAEPYLVELLRDSPLETVVSCVAHVNSPQRAEFFEDLGADGITLDTNINRDFGVLEAILRAVDCDIRLIVNEGCLYKCPFRHAHFNLFSHITTPRTSLLNAGAQAQPLNTFADYYFDKCISIRVRDPSQIVRSPWIRPEDLAEYEAIGIHDFKISGRANAVNWIINCVRAYSQRSLKGEGNQRNLLEILDCPSELRYAFHLDNELLGEAGSIKKWKRCRKICDECRFCDELTSKVLKVERK
ncbi:MAG: U32 family peptidase [Methanophagales archaeon]|nr:U32 family peptidase [Methanophagales archaeon]